MGVKKLMLPMLVIGLAWGILDAVEIRARSASRPCEKVFKMKPIGIVHNRDSSAWIEIGREYEDGLKGLDEFSHVWVIWWLDQNDIPSKREILQVHPRGNSRNPLTGVFATRSPVRPNLVAMTLCKIESVKGNKIRIDRIDAFDQTPVVDIKPYIPRLDHEEEVKFPAWLTGK